MATAEADVEVMVRRKEGFIDPDLQDKAEELRTDHEKEVAAMAAAFSGKTGLGFLMR